MKIVSIDKKDSRPGILYSDINYNIGVRGNKTVVTNLESIKQNILLIIGTPIRSKWFRPTVGNYLDTYLFDPIDDLQASKITDEVYRVLQNSPQLENRINVVKVDVLPDEPNNQYYIEIFYEVPEFKANNETLGFGIAR